MTIVQWILYALICACVFVVFRWLIPQVFAQVGWTVPDAVAAALALLIAIGGVVGFYRYRGRVL